MVQDVEEGLRLLVAIHAVTKTLCAAAADGGLDTLDELLKERERLLGRLPQYFTGGVRGEQMLQNRDALRRISPGLLEAITRENDHLMKLLQERKSSVVEQVKEIRLGKHIADYSREAML